MFASPYHLDQFETIDEKALKMFTDIIKKPDIIDIDIHHLNSLMKFVRRMKTEHSVLEISLVVIKGYIEKFGTHRPPIWTDIFCPRTINTLPKLTEWKFILEMLSQRDAVLTPLSIEDEAHKTFIVEKISKEIVDNFFRNKEDKVLLLLSCSAFGNKRFLWLRKYWTLLCFQSDLLCLVLSNTTDINSEDLSSVLNKIKVQRNSSVVERNSFLDDKSDKSDQITEKLSSYVFSLSFTVTFESDVLAWKCLYLLLSKSSGVFNDGDISEDIDIDLIESNMCKICNKCSKSTVVISPYKLACAVTFIAMLSASRTPKFKLELETLNYIDKYVKNSIKEDVHFPRILYK
jgi:hypothetical protein